MFSALPEESPAVGLRTPTLPCLAAQSPCCIVSSSLTSPRRTCDLLFLADQLRLKQWSVPSLDAQISEGDASRAVCPVPSAAYPGEAAGAYSPTSGPLQVLAFCLDTYRNPPTRHAFQTLFYVTFLGRACQFHSVAMINTMTKAN